MTGAWLQIRGIVAKIPRDGPEKTDRILFFFAMSFFPGVSCCIMGGHGRHDDGSS